jgi:hypothetical protein
MILKKKYYSNIFLNKKIFKKTITLLNMLLISLNSLDYKLINTITRQSTV